MKMVRLSLILVASLFAFSGMTMVASSPAQAWYCAARGTTGAFGWGTSNYLPSARAIALRQCAVRTPRYGRCVITYCR